LPSVHLGQQLRERLAQIDSLVGRGGDQARRHIPNSTTPTQTRTKLLSREETARSPFHVGSRRGMSTLPLKFEPSAMASLGAVMSPSTDPFSLISTFSVAVWLPTT